MKAATLETHIILKHEDYTESLLTQQAAWIKPTWNRRNALSALLDVWVFSWLLIQSL